MHTVDAHGARIPAIGLGTWLSPGPACGGAVEAAISAGYRHIDTAQLYGNEAWVGQAIARSGADRDTLFLTTKVHFDHMAPEAVHAAVEGSLTRLGTHIDLLLIHWPSRVVPVAETLGAMRTHQQRGDVRHLGVSNFTAAQLLEASQHAELVCNQVEYHPYLCQDTVLAACDRLGVVLTAYCPLAHGAVISDPVLSAIGARYGKTAAHVALRWLIQQPGVVAIPKSITPSRIEANLAVDDFVLTADEMGEVRALQRGTRACDPPSLAPTWDID